MLRKMRAEPAREVGLCGSGRLALGSFLIHYGHGWKQSILGPSARLLPFAACIRTPLHGWEELEQDCPQGDGG